MGFFTHFSLFQLTHAKWSNIQNLAGAAVPIDLFKQTFTRNYRGRNLTTQRFRFPLSQTEFTFDQESRLKSYEILPKMDKADFSS